MMRIKHLIFEMMNRGVWRSYAKSSTPEMVRRLLIRRHWRKSLKFPRTISIEITNACNAKCWFCSTVTSERIKGLMSSQLYEEIIDQIAPYAEHIDTIALFMDGEPTLHKKLVKFLKYAKNKGIKNIYLSSNMEFFTYELTDIILAENLGETLQYINASLDGATSNTFKNNRIGVDFDKAVRNTEYLIKKRNEHGYKYPWVFTRLLVNDLNKKEVDQFHARWKDIADKVMTTDMHNWGGKIKTNKIQNPKSMHDKYLCYFPWSQLAIQYDGIVRLCCMDTDTSTILGDLKNQLITDIWRSKEYDQIRNNMVINQNIPKICQDCTYPSKGTWLQPFYW